MIDVKEIARLIANNDSEGLTDEQFVELHVLLDKMRKEPYEKEYYLEKIDIWNFKPDDYAEYVKECLEEMIDTCCYGTAWWKQDTKDMHWHGCIYVDELAVHPDTYRVMFDKRREGMSFEKINSILSERAKNHSYEQIVPVSELDHCFRYEIKRMMLNNVTCGVVTAGCYSIHFNSHFFATVDGYEIPFENLSTNSKDNILNDMINNRSYQFQ